MSCDKLRPSANNSVKVPARILLATRMCISVYNCSFGDLQSLSFNARHERCYVVLYSCGRDVSLRAQRPLEAGA